MTVKLTCKDCEAEGLPLTRKATRPGPRCREHRTRFKKTASEAAWEKNTLSKYNLTKGEYWALYEAQGGRCALCQRATGKSKRLSVDHDHKTGYVRGLLCSQCNKILGWFRDSIEAIQRILNYLRKPPAHAIIGKRMVKGGPG